jgi:predicted nuclease with TOPRIM domain
MHSNREFRFRILCLTLLLLSGALSGFAGVSRSIQEQYKRDYENKAMFLKIPIYSEKQTIYINDQGFRVDQGIGAPRYKVGDQVRVLLVDFAGDEIKLRMSGISVAGMVEIYFRFDADLQESFPNKGVFNKALQATLTEGLKYTDIDEAKRSFVEEQFERSVQEISTSASIGRESVLKNIAPLVPAYQDARHENENLKNRVQDISTQLSQSQSENRKLESESKTQQAELSRLKSANAALQEKIDNSTSQISRLGDELRDVKGNAQGYQRELASIQRSLNIKVDSARDLAAQISDLGQAMKKMQKDSDALAGQIVTLRTNLDAQLAANARLVGDNEELKANNQQMKSTIATLTSNKDSLATQYLKLTREKEKLDNFSKSIAALRSRIEEEKTEDGFHYGRANVYVKNVLLGSLSWSIPISLNHNESKSCEVAFSAESIDSIRISPEERFLLRSLGDRLKIRVDLASDSATMSVTPGEGQPSREIGERDRSSWRWSIKNQGTQDTQFLITARLINKDSNEIPMFQQENTVTASNAVRQVRSYLQPIPLIAGVVLGFLLFGIVGIFRRPAKGKMAQKRPPSAGTSDPPPHITQKQL